MLYVDGELQFSDNQAVAASADATNIVDTGGGDKGVGDPPLHLYVLADGFTGGTLKVDLKTADAASGAAMVNPVTLATYHVEADKMAKGGQVVAARLPHGCKRYLGLSYTADGGGTDGKITAGLNMGTNG